ncbi:MAG: sigma-70 family RNA polymerase sigma factor [Planctomycetota bacterium]
MTADRAADSTADAEMSQILTGMQPRVRAFLRNLARGDLDDLVQETMTRAWRSRHTYDAARGTTDAWLMRIAFRAFLDRPRHPDHGPPSPEPVDGGCDPARRAALREHTAAMLAALSPREREILLRFHRDGESIDQIARATKVPAGTVKSHLHRARNRMLAFEQKNGGTP